MSTPFTSVFVFIIFVYYLQELHSKFTIGSLQKPLLKFRSINPFNLILYFAMIYSYPFGFQCFSSLLTGGIHWNHPIYQNQWWLPRTERRPVVKEQRHLVTKTSHQEKKDSDRYSSRKKMWNWEQKYQLIFDNIFYICILGIHFNK